MDESRAPSPAHTPGPWFSERHNLSEENRWLVRQDSDDGQVVAEVEPLPEAEANARLMAAAPELLTALEDLLGCCELNLDEMEQSTIESIERAMREVATARGRNV